MYGTDNFIHIYERIVKFLRIKKVRCCFSYLTEISCSKRPPQESIIGNWRCVIQNGKVFETCQA